MSKSAANSIDPSRQLEADQAVIEARRLRDADEIDAATAMAQQAVAADPTHIGALRLLGALSRQTGAAEISIGSFQRALTLSPGSPEILIEYGDALVAGKRPAEAVTAFRQAMALRPKDPAVFRGLGQAQLDMGEHTDALESFRRVLAIIPYDRFAAHMAASLAGNAAATSQGYVAKLFDDYADQFDQHLTLGLGYRVPEIFAEMLADRPSLGTLLDLGCGTGLVGAALQHKTTAMDGIDIAAQMTLKAQARNIYRHLGTGDTVDMLTTDPALSGPYDIVTAGDVFVYVGPLEATFAAVARVIAPSGLFAFTVESATGTDVTLRSSGRFSHPPAYIAALATQHGFDILVQRDTPLRQERNQPIPGTLYLLSHA